jgi:hypothetical protein
MATTPTASIIWDSAVMASTRVVAILRGMIARASIASGMIARLSSTTAVISTASIDKACRYDDSLGNRTIPMGLVMMSSASLEQDMTLGAEILMDSILTASKRTVMIGKATISTGTIESGVSGVGIIVSHILPVLSWTFCVIERELELAMESRLDPSVSHNL